MQKLTQKLVDNFALSQQKQLILRDTELRGFGLSFSEVHCTNAQKSSSVMAPILRKPKNSSVIVLHRHLVNTASEHLAIQ